MNQLRLDPLSGRWVATTTDRHEIAPSFFPHQPFGREERSACPYCPGRAYEGAELLESRSVDNEWTIRVVEHAHPVFSGNQPFVVDHRGPVFAEAPVSGRHEVIVLSQDHDLSWASFGDQHCALIMDAIRERIDVHQLVPGLRYSQVLVNSGREAGASHEHPHGQLLGIPFIPRSLVDEQASFSRFAGGCLLCTAVTSEERVGYRVIESSERTLTFAPYWSGSPYEILIVPRTHEPLLNHARPDDLAGVGEAIRNSLAALRHRLGDVAYNLVFHAAPYRARSPFHWHAHIWPKCVNRAGFELGTGVHVNVIAPEQAAEELKSAIAQLSLAASAQTDADVAS